MTSPRFKIDPSAARPSVPLEGFALVFHRPSGITHILAAPVPEILEALEDGPADTHELVARLAARHQIVDTAEAEAIVTARLTELEAAGLVERL